MTPSAPVIFQIFIHTVILLPTPQITLELRTNFALQLAYEPVVTPLVAQMRVHRDRVKPSWVVVDSLENLCEMAVETFELMTGRLAPRRLMKEVCHETWEQQRREMLSTS